MPCFEMIKYHKLSYPDNIQCRTEEIAAHFDISSIHPQMDYSLHTEYSYGMRAFSNDALIHLNEIVNSNKQGVPQLWKNELWAEEFAEFIFRISSKMKHPKVIEIHPPFNDYTCSMSAFVKNYMVFEDAIMSRLPETMILIENRSGSIYKGGKFIISKYDQIVELCNQIEQRKLRLKVALDIPQLYTAHNVDRAKDYLVDELLNELKVCREHIRGVHLWGKRVSENGRTVAHCGDFNSYFNDNMELKFLFLSALNDLFDDGTCRNLVLEVNSGSEDMLSIINDLVIANFRYI